VSAGASPAPVDAVAPEGAELDRPSKRFRIALAVLLAGACLEYERAAPDLLAPGIPSHPIC